MFFFFFKQKTAYEMRISDWSSDVCSSDLLQSRLAVIGGVRGNVQQNQFPSIRVLQLQTSGLNGLISAQVDRAAGALHPQALAHAGGYANAHVAVDKHNALLTNDHRPGQPQAFPASHFHSLCRNRPKTQKSVMLGKRVSER